ncbi:hypothetical protein BJ912DRAFT_988900 [Pholiota molesta]|nr:hypothetical protein BJ912DRAFT_988900 [Pholiota molesta]
MGYQPEDMDASARRDSAAENYSAACANSQIAMSGFTASAIQDYTPTYFSETLSSLPPPSRPRWDFAPMDDPAASQQHSASWMDEASMPLTASSSALPSSSSSSSSELAGNSQMAMSAFAVDGYPNSSPAWLPQTSSPPSGAPWNFAPGVYSAADQGVMTWMGESSTSQNASNGAFPSSSSDLANDAPPSTSSSSSLAPPPPSLSDAVSSSWRNDLSSSPMSNTRFSSSALPAVSSVPAAFNSSPSPEPASYDQTSTEEERYLQAANGPSPSQFQDAWTTTTNPTEDSAAPDVPPQARNEEGLDRQTAQQHDSADNADFHLPSTSPDGGASPPPTSSSSLLPSSTSANHAEDPHARDPLPRARSEGGLDRQLAQQRDRADTADFHSPSTSSGGGASPPSTSSSSSSSPPSLSNTMSSSWPNIQPLSWVPNTRFSLSIALRSGSSNSAAFTSWCPTEPASYIPDGATGSSSSSAPTATPSVRENVTTDSLLSWVMRNFSSAAFRYLDDERFLALHRENPSDIQTLREAARRHGIARKDLEAFVGRACRGGIKLKALINE